MLFRLLKEVKANEMRNTTAVFLGKFIQDLSLIDDAMSDCSSFDVRGIYCPWGSPDTL